MTKDEKLVARFKKSLRKALSDADRQAEERESSLDRIHDSCVLAGLDEDQQQKVMRAVEHEMDWLAQR